MKTLTFMVLGFVVTEVFAQSGWQPLPPLIFSDDLAKMAKLENACRQTRDPKICRAYEQSFDACMRSCLDVGSDCRTVCFPNSPPPMPQSQLYGGGGGGGGSGTGGNDHSASRRAICVSECNQRCNLTSQGNQAALNACHNEERNCKARCY